MLIHNVGDALQEIGEEKVVCAASPSLGPAGEVSQMSPAVPSLHVDKENLDNVLVLTSPYRPSKNPSPHPKKVFDPPPISLHRL